MLAVSLYLIFDSLQKTPQTEFAILVVFSFILAFFFWKANLVSAENFAYRYLVFVCSWRGDKRNHRRWRGQGDSIKTFLFLKKERLKKNPSYNKLCFPTVNVGYLVNCLVVLQHSWNWKTNTEMILLMWRGFFCSRASGGCIDQGRRTKLSLLRSYLIRYVERL